MKTKLILVALIILSGVVIAALPDPQPHNVLATQVRWFAGHLVLAAPLPPRRYPADQIVMDAKGQRQEFQPPSWNFAPSEEFEIGLRADGVVVWRKKP